MGCADERTITGTSSVQGIHSRPTKTPTRVPTSLDVHCEPHKSCPLRFRLLLTVQLGLNDIEKLSVQKLTRSGLNGVLARDF